MNFLALRQQVQKWEKESKPVAVIKVEPSKAIESTPVPFHPAYQKPNHKVVGGDISRDPRNKQAAMIVAKAPWWAYPLPPPPNLAPPVPIVKPVSKPKLKSKPEKIMIDVHPGNYPLPAEKPLSGQEVSAAIAEKMTNKTVKTVNDAHSLVEKATDARAALDVMAESFQKNWNEFIETSEHRLKQLRETRMATETEMRKLTASIREVRSFFLDSNYEKELGRLKEFVELCERLQKLKESGFLDTVADTMLRLAYK